MDICAPGTARGKAEQWDALERLQELSRGAGGLDSRLSLDSDRGCEPHVRPGRLRGAGRRWPRVRLGHLDGSEILGKEQNKTLLEHLMIFLVRGEG